MLRSYLRLLLLAILVSPALPVLAQTSISASNALAVRGHVTDEGGRPLEGVEVTAAELGRRARTDGDGAYTLTELPRGRYTLSFRRLGYAAEARSVEAGGTLDVVLHAVPFEAESVTVTASRTPEARLETSLPISVLGPEALRREHGVSLAHTLEHVPGVRTLSTGEQIGKPVIRGLSGPRVLVLENGLRLEDYSWSDEDGPSVDARLADRVELIRGPASVLYGSDAVGGVVNVVPEPLPDASARGVRTGVEAYAASNNTEGGGLVRAEGVRGRIGWRGVVIGRVAEDYRTPSGKLENTGFLALNGEAAAGTSGAWGSVQARVAHYGGEFRLLEAGELPAGFAKNAAVAEEEEGPVRRLFDDRLQVLGSFPAGAMRLEAKAQLQRHWLAEGEEEEKRVAGEEGGEAEFELGLTTFTTDLLAHHTLGRGVTGTVGLTGTAQGSESEGGRRVVPGAEVVSGAAFAFEQLDLGRLRLLGGARFDARALTPEADATLGVAGDRATYHALTWDAGVVVQPVPMLALTANVGRGYRAPTFFELYANGPRIGEARYEIGRADLDPETSLSLDAGLRVQHDRLRASLDVFRSTLDHYIFLAPTSETRDGLAVYRHVQSDATMTGAEASAEVDVLPVLTLRARYDAVRGDDEGADRPLPLVPPAREAAEAELHTTHLSWADRAYLRAEVEHTDEQTRLGLFDTPTGTYTLVDVGAGLARMLNGHAFHADVLVRNAGDVAYRSFLSRYKAFADNPGRNIVVRLGLEL